jgi:hypothetical protein
MNLISVLFLAPNPINGYDPSHGDNLRFLV